MALVLLFVAGCATPAAPPPGSGIRGVATMGPTCPVERQPPDPQCADRPYHGDLEVVATGDGRAVATFATDAGGNFSVAVPPGTYTIRHPAAASGLPRCASEGTITVVPSAYTRADVACDTGIR